MRGTLKRIKRLLKKEWLTKEVHHFSPNTNPLQAGYEARNVDARELIHNANPISNYYLPENERFDHDFSAYDKRIREKQRQKVENNMEQRRVINLEREQTKWDFMQKEA